MFHKLKDVTVLSNNILLVQFPEGVTKLYDMNELIKNNSIFKMLKDEKLYNNVSVDVGGYGIIWNDHIDLSCDELYENGKITKTLFDGLMALSDATIIWNLNESTLRKAISYGKLVNGIDVCKYGKQWVVSIEAMKREYGIPNFRY